MTAQKFRAINPTNPSVSITPLSLSAALTGCFLDCNSYAWAWGNGSSGQLGVGTTVNSSVPVSVFGGKRWYSLAVSQGGDFFFGAEIGGNRGWTWGTANATGAIGDGTTVPRSSPVSLLTTGTFWYSVAITPAINAIMLSNYPYYWGTISASPPVYASSPISIPGGRQFTYGMVSGNDLTNSTLVVGVDANKYAWSWGCGANTYGVLGNNTVASSTSPVSVVGNRQLSRMVVGTGLAVGTDYAIGLDINQYAWSWGYNGGGQLGDGTISHRSSPVSVLGGRRWAYIFASQTNTVYGIDLSGYAWSWGANDVGQLGDGTTIPKSSPVSLATSQQFYSIQANATKAVIALGTDFAVWSWGYGGSGALGLGSTTNQSFPVRTPLTGQKGVTLMGQMAMATDGRWVWTWGTNASGIGDGTTNARLQAVPLNTGSLPRTGRPTAIYGY